MAELVIIHTTVDSAAFAEMLMKRVVDERAAACAVLSPQSKTRYHWKGGIETAVEWCLTFKTRADLFERVADIIKELHPYDIPEIIATPIVLADKTYADWLLSETCPK